MDQENTFRYNYSAKENKEIQEIRRRYLPRKENSLEELRRLDSTVQSSGLIEALCAGIGGALIFGLGLCLAMQVLGSGTLFTVLGIVLGVTGTGVMLTAYPIYRRVYSKTKGRYTPRILELAETLSRENNR